MYKNTEKEDLKDIKCQQWLLVGDAHLVNGKFCSIPIFYKEYALLRQIGKKIRFLFDFKSVI